VKKLADEAELMLSLVGSKIRSVSPLIASMLAVLIRMLTVKLLPTESCWLGLASWSLNTWACTPLTLGKARRKPSEIKMYMISLVFVQFFIL